MIVFFAWYKVLLQVIVHVPQSYSINDTSVLCECWFSNLTRPPHDGSPGGYTLVAHCLLFNLKWIMWLTTKACKCYLVQIILSSVPKYILLNTHLLSVHLPVVTFLWKIEVSRFSFIFSKMFYLSEELFIVTEQKGGSRSNFNWYWFNKSNSRIIHKTPGSTYWWKPEMEYPNQQINLIFELKAVSYQKIKQLH